MKWLAAAVAWVALSGWMLYACTDDNTAHGGSDNTGNDRVLRGDKKEFIEVFKKDDAGGDKNYVYTITQFTDSWGRHCTVVTGDSEKTIALDCDPVPGGG